MNYHKPHQAENSASLSKTGKDSSRDSQNNVPSLKKSSSLRTLNAIANSIKQRFTGSKKSTRSKSVECILSTDGDGIDLDPGAKSQPNRCYDEGSLQTHPYCKSQSVDALDNMVTLRRAESDRRVITRGPR